MTSLIIATAILYKLKLSIDRLSDFNLGKVKIRFYNLALLLYLVATLAYLSTFCQKASPDLLFIYLSNSSIFFSINAKTY